MKLRNSFFFKLILVFIYVFLSINGEIFPEEIEYAKALVTTPSGDEIPVEVADTLWKRRLGLGKRTELKKNWGMLFVFNNLKNHRFWMKNMNFPLDIIWLENHQIVYILENVHPTKSGEDPIILEPLAPANFVLEIAAGRANKLNLKKGDFLNYKF